MELKCLNSVQRAALAGLLAAAASLAAGPPPRIRAEIQNRQTFRLAGNVHPQIASAQDQGEVADSLALPRIAIHFQMTAAQQADLDHLLQAQQDPSSPQFHQWLTPEEYGDRFGLSTADLSRVTAWLEHMGFTDVQVARGRTFVTMSGVAAVARYAFQTPIHSYLVDGIRHYANASEPALPVELEGVVAGIRGLSDFRPRPHARPKPRYTSSLTGNHFLAPGDFATIYNLQPLYNSGINGSGQSIAIAGQTGTTGQMDPQTGTPAWVQASDIEAFQAASGLPVKDPTFVSDGFNSQASSGDEAEAALDLEWAGAVARGATIIYVNSMDAFSAAIYAVDHNVAAIVSLTYGLCEDQSKGGLTLSQVNSMNTVFQQANAQGITVVVASGDLGAADCEAAQSPLIATNGLGVDFPASSPYVTGMGGTEFNDASGTYWSSSNGVNSGSALTYIPEIVWNDTANPDNISQGGGLAATGGGVSVIFAKPAWQQGTGVPNGGFRAVPDVSLSASNFHDGYLVCDAGWCTNGYRDAAMNLDVIGGTSAGAPAFAGIVALINQQMHSRQGNVNPTLYSLAARSPSAFHDITVGNNIVPCQIGTPNCTTGSLGYSAGTGYDMVTGLGTVNAQTLVTAWSTAVGPQAPVLASPANGATGVAPSTALTWQASTGATSYNIFFGTVSPPPQVTQTSSTTYSPAALSGGVTYYWSITAVNSSGSASSAIWSFTTSVVAPPAPVLASPANGATGVALSPALIWQASTGATSYTVFFGTASPPSPVLQTGATSYSPGALGAGVTYYWSVTAVNSAGNASSGIRSFTTAPPAVVPPPAPVLTSPASGATGVALSPTLTWQASTGATSYNVSFGTVSPPPQVTQTAATTYSPGALSAGVTYYWRVTAVNSAGSASSAVSPFTTQAGANSGALLFVPVTPCRVADTRFGTGPFGGPFMTAGSSRSFPIPQSSCGIPATAQAYSLNVTVVPQGLLSFLTLWPTGQNQPLVSTLNSFQGIVVANAAIVPAGTGGAVSVGVTDNTDVILDIDGYFSDAAGGAAFYAATPCRVLDTRTADGPLGGPFMTAGETRDFPVLSSPCGLPSSASAYSMNVTVVPSGLLSYLTTWPTGQGQPNVSTLNSFTGKVVANAAIVPSGAGGDVSVYVSDATQVIFDTNGYFGAPGGSGALSFYPVTPCRVADTRGADGPFGGPSLTAGSVRSFTLPDSACSIPSTAQAYSLNVTVVPAGLLSFLTAWPAGEPQPFASTLNSFDGSIVANAAIVPAGASGAISVYVTDATDVILDIDGYFAP